MPEFVITRSGELKHFGIKGQKWGVRRYQNPDGSWTDAGKERYGAPDRHTEKLMKRVNKISKLGWRDQRDALRKLSKDKKFIEVVDDDDLRAKRAAYKTAQDEWYKRSKGEDFDAYDDETGYDNYGITPKEFREIMKLDAKRVAAQDRYIGTVKKKVNSIVNEYSKHPLSKIKMTESEQERITRLLVLAAWRA